MNNEKDFIEMIGGAGKKTKRGQQDDEEDYGEENGSGT